MMLTRKSQGLSQKSLTILLALGLLGGAAAAQLGARPSMVHAHDGAYHAPGCLQPGRYQFSQQSGSECAARNRRRLFAEDHRRQAVQDQNRSGEPQDYSSATYTKIRAMIIANQPKK